MSAASSEVWGAALGISSVSSLSLDADAIFGGACLIAVTPSIYAQCIGAQFCTIAISAVSAVTALANADYYGAICAISAVSALDLAALAYVTQTLGFDGTITAGDVLIIDTDNLTVTLNGANVREDFTGTFWKLYGGTNEVAWHSAASATAELKVEHEPRDL